jgi:DNA-binding transcriptional ArsR family regulator
MAEFATDVSLEDIAVRDTRVSSAVDEPVRATILDMLADQEHTISTLHEELGRRGYDRTENTVRHHVNELRDAGLIEVARLEERRGGTTKYYRANTVVLSYSLPESAEATVDRMAERVQPQIADALSTLRAEFAEEIDAAGAEMAPCEHCRTQKYETYILLTALRRAFVDAYVRGDRVE